MNLIKSCCLFVVFSSFLACTSQVSDVKSVSYTEFVNPFIGTDFTGDTYPGAQAPFGMVQLSPDNGLPGWDRISGYFIRTVPLQASAIPISPEPALVTCMTSLLCR